MTDSNSVTRCFQTKTNSSPFKNASDFALQYNLLWHTLPEKWTLLFFYRVWSPIWLLKLSLKSEKTFLHNQLKSTLNQLEEHKRSSLFSHRRFWNAIRRNAMATQTRKSQSCKAKSVITVSQKHVTDKCTYTLMHNIKSINKVPRIIIETNADLVFPKFRRQMLGLPFHEQISTKIIR